MLVSEIKTNLTGMLHGGTLNKVRNVEYALERAANVTKANTKSLDLQRTTALTSLIYDDIYNYALPADYWDIVDLIPQDNRESGDSAQRMYAEKFDLKKAFQQKKISIESNDGTKFIRINWRTKSAILYNSMNSLTANGAWSAVASASGLRVQTLFKISGNGSIEFDVSATGDGIQNTTATNIDLVDEDEIADVFLWVHIPTSANLTNFTSATVRWGNDLTANYWQSTAVTTQADGTAFKVGWNLLKFAWASATETGTVAPATIDSFRIVFTVVAAINNLKVDNIVFAVGRNFDLKYLSEYSFKNSSGTFLIRPTADSDEVVYTGTALEIFLMESLKACAQQMEGEDSTFDINFANLELQGNADSPDPIQRRGLYAKYRSQYPSQVKKTTTSWTTPRSGNFRYR